MAVSNNKSSLSAGEIIRGILAADPAVTTRVNKIYPVIVDKAELPYITYRRASLQQDPVKGSRGADTVGIEVICYTAGYTEGVELAEAVRDALDGATGTSEGLLMRSCFLSDSEEAWQDDAYLQQLIFTVKI